MVAIVPPPSPSSQAGLFAGDWKLSVFKEDGKMRAHMIHYIAAPAIGNEDFMKAARSIFAPQISLGWNGEVMHQTQPQTITLTTSRAIKEFFAHAKKYVPSRPNRFSILLDIEPNLFTGRTPTPELMECLQECGLDKIAARFINPNDRNVHDPEKHRYQAEAIKRALERTIARQH